MDKISNIFFKYRVVILTISSLILISVVLFKLDESYFKYHIMVKFVESGPLFKNMPVCYKGYRIGRTEKITLSEDYKYTLVEVVLYPKNPKIPKDVEGVVKKHDVLKNYIDLITPEGSTTTALLKNGDTIDGRGIFDMGTFLAEIANSGLIIPLIQNFSGAALSLDRTSVKIGNFFSDSRLILKDNRQNLNQAARDLAVTSKSLKKITSKFNTSITEDKLNNTTSSVSKASTNILTATENIKNITQSVDCATRNLDKTIAKIDSTVSDTNVITSNVKTITSGFCQILGKRFAGLRIIFGKPLKSNSCCKNCSK